MLARYGNDGFESRQRQNHRNRDDNHRQRFKRIEILNNMDKWNTDTHTRTGLVERVKSSTYTETQVETELLQFMQTWLPEKATPMCGNTIHQDRRFMVRHMPKLENYFHYRNLDVSTIKELARRWSPAVYKGVVKKGSHKALDDIVESIEELKHYRDTFFRLPEKN